MGRLSIPRGDPGGLRLDGDTVAALGSYFTLRVWLPRRLLASRWDRDGEEMSTSVFAAAALFGTATVRDSRPDVGSKKGLNVAIAATTMSTVLTSLRRRDNSSASECSGIQSYSAGWEMKKV